jgi:cell division protein FtsZ
MITEDGLLSVNLKPQKSSLIKVIGVGGGGSNAVNYMYNQGITGVDFVVCNTDIQALRNSPISVKIQIGKELTKGLGAGSIPERGKKSALENIEYVKSILDDNTKMVFITAGMGGGTGTGAAPVIAKEAREVGILTVGIVTIPFYFEGRQRLERALEGIEELSNNVDALLVINNQKLRDMYGNLKLSEAFSKADDVLLVATKSLAEIITVRGFVNVDFKDVESIMKNSGVAVMGAGEEAGEERGINALKEALNSPLLNSSDIMGASNILLNIISGSKEVTMDEIGGITSYLKELVGPGINIIWGAGHDDFLEEKLRVAIIATGFHRKPLPTYDESGEDKQEEETPELELIIENPEIVEKEAKVKRKAKSSKPRFNKQSEKNSVNTDMSVDTWFKRRFSQIFEDKDTKM